MRRGKICIAIGAFIIGTALICNSNRPQVYEKKMCFNNPEEIVEILNNNPISSYKEQYSGEIVYSDKFLECLSFRKRVTGSNLYVSDYDLHINKDKDNDEYRNTMISKYKVMTNNLKDYNLSEDIMAYNLVGTSKNINGNENTEDMDVIFVKEGEGWVIDYIIENSNTDPSHNYDRS